MTFAGVSSLLSGLADVARGAADLDPAVATYHHQVLMGLSEAMTPMFVACGFLSASWLAVAVGIRRA